MEDLAKSCIPGTEEARSKPVWNLEISDSVIVSTKYCRSDADPGRDRTVIVVS
jgi:hypothetical protein